jgi:hypothetical protein
MYIYIYISASSIALGCTVRLHKVPQFDCTRLHKVSCSHRLCYSHSVQVPSAIMSAPPLPPPAAPAAMLPPWLAACVLVLLAATHHLAPDVGSDAFQQCWRYGQVKRDLRRRGSGCSRSSPAVPPWWCPGCFWRAARHSSWAPTARPGRTGCKPRFRAAPSGSTCCTPPGVRRQVGGQGAVARWEGGGPSLSELHRPCLCCRPTELTLPSTHPARAAGEPHARPPAGHFHATGSHLDALARAITHERDSTVDMEFYEYIHQRGRSRLNFEVFNYENLPHGETAAGPSSRQPPRQPPRGLADSQTTCGHRQAMAPYTQATRRTTCRSRRTRPRWGYGTETLRR